MEKAAFVIQPAFILAERQRKVSLPNSRLLRGGGKARRFYAFRLFWYKMPIGRACASWPSIQVGPWLLRAKLCAIVDQHKLLILDVYNYVWFTIAVNIPNFTGDGG